MRSVNFFRSALLICCCLAATVLVKGSKGSVKAFGAKGNGVADDSQAIQNAVMKLDTIIFPQGTYKISRLITFNGLKNKVIQAQSKAVIINTNLDSGSFLFENCENIVLKGGKWTRPLVSKQGGKEQHTFAFRNVHSLLIDGLYIDGSPEMGIALSEVVDGTVTNCKIRNCFRDGIYAHYSAKLTYANNDLANIKDDAMSMHDYGIPAQKKHLIQSGYPQAGNAVIKNNKVNNCYQGFSSIGCQNITVINNNITNTVGAGIAVFNAENMMKGSTARVENVTVKGNVLRNNGGKQSIMAKAYPNFGQLTTGRSALFFGVLDSSNLINNPKSKLRNIRIEDNSITNCHVNGAYLAQIDNLFFKNNSFVDCNLDKSRFTGRIVELRNCDDVYVYANKVEDLKKTSSHIAGFEVKNVSGEMGKWNVKGFSDAAGRFESGKKPKEIQ